MSAVGLGSAHARTVFTVKVCVMLLVCGPGVSVKILKDKLFMFTADSRRNQTPTPQCVGISNLRGKKNMRAHGTRPPRPRLVAGWWSRGGRRRNLTPPVTPSRPHPALHLVPAGEAMPTMRTHRLEAFRAPRRHPLVAAALMHPAMHTLARVRGGCGCVRELRIRAPVEAALEAVPRLVLAIAADDAPPFAADPPPLAARRSPDVAKHQPRPRSPIFV